MTNDQLQQIVQANMEAVNAPFQRIAVAKVGSQYHVTGGDALQLAWACKNSANNYTWNLHVINGLMVCTVTYGHSWDKAKEFLNEHGIYTIVTELNNIEPAELEDAAA